MIAPIEWAREKGILRIWDQAMRTWHEVPMDAVPRWWRQAASEAKNSRKLRALPPPSMMEPEGDSDEAD